MRRVFRGLAVAPLTGVIVLAPIIVWRQYPDAPISDLFAAATVMAPFCYVAEALFFVPAMLLLRQLRQPRLLVATIVGVVAAPTAVIPFTMLMTSTIPGPHAGFTLTLASLPFAVAGGISGFTYGWVARNRYPPDHALGLPTG